MNFDRAQLVKAANQFEEYAKTGRVFLASDVLFKHKYETFLTAAKTLIVKSDGDSIVVSDKTILKAGDKPKDITLTYDDAVAILDDSKVGLFGNIKKCDCTSGLLLTTKGVLTYNNYDGKVKYSGFISWDSFMAGSPLKMAGIVGGVNIFRAKNNTVFPNGPWIGFVFGRTKKSNITEFLEQFVRNLRFIGLGKGDEYDYLDYQPEEAEELDDEESASELEDEESAVEAEEEECANESED